jgi:pre-mRNA-splicing factor SPF27
VPFLTAITDVDPPLSDAARAAIIASIRQQRPPESESTLHPLVNTAYTPGFSSLITAEHDRIAASAPRPAGTGIDLSRYEADALEPPNRTFPESDEERPEFLEQWRTTLRLAYASSNYLSGRNTNLALLETYGKNAWLVANWHQEAILKSLEAELADVKATSESVAEENRRRQDAAAAELAVLDESWKRGIRGVIEVQVATDALRQDVLDKRREAVGQ